MPARELELGGTPALARGGQDVEILAPGKINLGLQITGRRLDGFHFLRSIMVPISLCDRVRIRMASDLDVQTSGYPAPSGRGNLVFQVLDAFRTAVSRPDWGAHVSIAKHVPAAAGLGGGSADAAAALRGANELWGVHWTEEQLSTWSGQHGADLPFCIQRVSALVEGVGERVRPFTFPLPQLSFVLVMPHTCWTGPKTAAVYREYDMNPTPSMAPIDALEQALRKGDLAQVGACLSNDLEQAASRLHPEILDVKQLLLDSGALGAVMSGSGPTVLGLANDAAHARILERGLQRSGWWVAQADVVPSVPAAYEG